MPLTKEGSSAPGPPKSHGLPQSSTSDISLLHPPLLSSHLVLSYHFHHDCTPSTQGLSYSTIDRPSSSCLSSLYPSIDGCRQNLSVAQQQPRNAGHARLPVETLLFCALGWKSIVGNSNPSDYCRQYLSSPASRSTSCRPDRQYGFLAPTSASSARRASPTVCPASKPRPMRFNCSALPVPEKPSPGSALPRKSCLRVRLAVAPSTPAPAASTPAPAPIPATKPAPGSLARYGLKAPSVRAFENFEAWDMASERLKVLNGDSEGAPVSKSLLPRLLKEHSIRATKAHKEISDVDVEGRDEPSVDVEAGRELAQWYGTNYDVPAPKTVSHVTVAVPSPLWLDLFSFSLPAIEWTSRLWASMTFFPFPVCLSHNGRCSDVRPDGLRFSDSANQAIPNHFMATPMAHQYPSPCCRGCFPRSYRRKTADAAIWNEVRFHCRRDIAYLDFRMLTVTVTATTSTRRRANLGHSEAMDYDHVSSWLRVRLEVAPRTATISKPAPASLARIGDSGLKPPSSAVDCSPVVSDLQKGDTSSGAPHGQKPRIKIGLDSLPLWSFPGRCFPSALPLKSCLRVRLQAAPRTAPTSKAAPASLARFRGSGLKAPSAAVERGPRVSGKKLAKRRVELLMGVDRESRLDWSLPRILEEHSRQVRKAHSMIAFVVVEDEPELSVNVDHGRELARQFGTKYDVPAPLTMAHVTVAAPKAARVHWDPAVMKRPFFKVNRPYLAGPPLRSSSCSWMDSDMWLISSPLAKVSMSQLLRSWRTLWWLHPRLSGSSGIQWSSRGLFAISTGPQKSALLCSPLLALEWIRGMQDKKSLDIVQALFNKPITVEDRLTYGQVLDASPAVTTALAKALVRPSRKQLGKMPAGPMPTGSQSANIVELTSEPPVVEAKHFSFEQVMSLPLKEVPARGHVSNFYTLAIVRTHIKDGVTLVKQPAFLMRRVLLGGGAEGNLINRRLVAALGVAPMRIGRVVMKMALGERNYVDSTSRCRPRLLPLPFLPLPDRARCHALQLPKRLPLSSVALCPATPLHLGRVPCGSTSRLTTAPAPSVAPSSSSAPVVSTPVSLVVSAPVPAPVVSFRSSPPVSAAPCSAPARVSPQAPLKSCLRVRLAAAPKPSKPAPRSLARFGYLRTPVDLGDEELKVSWCGEMSAQRLKVLQGKSKDKSLLPRLRKEHARRAAAAHSKVALVDVHGRELAR
ncbi:hypothetical protein HDK90DRAFT_465112 [Phyllosticta capitalensis]|uniref:Uncharacterized protein n=1 Tax=Phyllosticta capitalensis TaxID=121624 RepID=A0ABR1YTJ8_9PEZI